MTTQQLKPFKYHIKDYDSMIIYTCDTDFRIYRYKEDLTIYKKGNFRKRMDKVVLMVRDITKEPIKEEFFYFDTIKQAKDYIKKNYLKGELKEHEGRKKQDQKT